MGTGHAGATSSSSEDDEEYAKFASVAVNADDVRRESVSTRGRSNVEGGAVPEGVAKSVSEALWKKLDTGIEFGTMDEDSNSGNPSCSRQRDIQDPGRDESRPGLRLFRRGPKVKGDCTPHQQETKRQRPRTESILPKRRQIDHDGISISDVEPLIVVGRDIMDSQRRKAPPYVDIPKAKKRRMLRNFELYNTPFDVEEYS